MRILVVTTCLGGGGAERHVVRLANAWQATDNVQVEIGVLRGAGSYQQFLDQRVSCQVLAPQWVGHKTLLACLLARRRLSRLIERFQPDVVFTVLQPATWAVDQLAQKHHAQPFPLRVAAVQNHFQHQGIGRLPKSVTTWMANAVSRVDHVVAISSGVAASVIQRFPQLAERITVIHNAAMEDHHEPKPIVGSLDYNSPPRLIACGRLVEQKGFDLLLMAVKEVSLRQPITLTVLGEGPERAALESLRAKLKLENIVHFAGFVANPLQVFNEHDLFVLSSRWEGFGNVIVEAMSVGLPVVATDCQFGPAEIIRNGLDGWLTPGVNDGAIAETLQLAINNRAQWPAMGVAARQRAEDFEATKIATEHLHLFTRLSSLQTPT